MLGGVLATAGLLLFLCGHGSGGAGEAAGAMAAQPPTVGDSFEPQLGLPADSVVAFGSSPGEAPGETWAYGQLGATPVYVEGHAYSEQFALLEHSGSSSAWQVVPLPAGPEGKPLAVRGSSGPAAYGALAGQATEAGGVVLLSGGDIVVRDPGGHPVLVPEPLPMSVGSGEETSPGDEKTDAGEEQSGSSGSDSSDEQAGSSSMQAGASVEQSGSGGKQSDASEQSGSSGRREGVLAAGESLLPANTFGKATVPYAAIEEEGGAHTGVLIAPDHDGGATNASGEPETQPGVLHYDGREWTREPIDATGEEERNFTALALACSGTPQAPGASSPENCWLLTGYGHGREVEHLALFRRVRTGASHVWSWLAQPVSDWLLGAAPLPSGVSSVSVAPLAQGAQMLTATAQGVWVDFQARVNGQAAPVDVSELVLGPAAQAGEAGELPQASVAGTWCWPTGLVCERSLGAALPESYRSFAWPGSSPTDPGTRVLTGLPARAMLELANGSFSYTVGAGGEAGFDPGAAALYRSSSQAPVEGVIADGQNPGEDGPDGEGQSQEIDVTAHAEGDQLHEEPVPFRHPLLALAQAPGATPGDPGAEVLAVGLEGQIGRYIPGQGWRPEALYDSAGQAQTPTLRGVAWPEAGRAYAVGDNGAMWLWRAETGLWEPDPAKPFNFIGNLTAIAFQPGEPQVGYAVGKQGVLLRYGKSWEQISGEESRQLEQELKVEEWRLNFTSIAFAGSEALATYRLVAEEGGNDVETGGLLFDDGSGWHVDTGAGALLAQLANARDTVLSKVAGLPDGGAVAAGPDVVIERDSSGSAWRFSQTPLPEAQNISALAAYREAGGPVRAVVSIELDQALNPGGDGNLQRGPFSGDVPVPTGAGQPPPFIPPDPLPDSGYVLEETAGGWRDMEHEALPVKFDQIDMPVRPDPVLALLVAPSGGEMLAVGGQTYDSAGGGPYEEAETAAALRFPAVATTVATAPLSVPSGQTSFVVGGMGACEEACDPLANESIGPDVWLTHALQTANRISGVSAFLYTGGRVPGGTVVASDGSAAFERELARFGELLGSAGPLPVYAASSSELEPPGIGSEPFERTIVPSGVTHGPPGTAAYSQISKGSSGAAVKVIVLDYSGGTLEASAGSEPQAQEHWLEQELLAAKSQGTPAIVMGYDSLGFSLPDQIGSVATQARDAEAVSKILLQDEASAYLFDYPGVNVRAQVSYGGRSIPAYGTGTLSPQSPATGKTDSLQSSGFLVLSVNTATREPGTRNVAPVSAQAVPNVGQLALDATNGALLRRSQVALFEGLARRPAAGVAVGGTDSSTGGRLIYPSSYDPIPTICQGTNCPYEVPLDYTFTSSNTDIGNFVAHEASSANPLQVELGADSLPIADPHSGLFCAFNEGTTTVSITTGGLTYSEPVTVQGGSAEYPCGTVPLKNPPPRTEPASSSFPVPSLSPATPSPLAPQIQSLAPPPPVPVAAPAMHHTHQPLLPPVPPPTAQLFPVLALVPPPAPGVARPTPPSGTAQVPSQSPVSQQVSVAEREHEEENAIEGVHNMASYSHPDGGPMPAWPLGLVLFAVAAAVGLRPRFRSSEPVYVRESSRRSGRE
jgi:hypothetical protein